MPLLIQVFAVKTSTTALIISWPE